MMIFSLANVVFDLNLLLNMQYAQCAPIVQCVPGAVAPVFISAKTLESAKND